MQGCKLALEERDEVPRPLRARRELPRHAVRRTARPRPSTGTNLTARNEGDPPPRMVLEGLLQAKFGRYDAAATERKREGAYDTLS